MMERDVRRVLRFLSGGSAPAVPAADGRKLVLGGGDRGSIAVAAAAMRSLVAEGLVEARGETVALTPAGHAHNRRRDAAGDGFQEQHRTLERRPFDMGDGPVLATVNLDESPLGTLARRKDRDGRPLLAPDEVAAGERLRADYTRGQIMPRLGANWQAAVASGRRDGGRGGVAELTEAALSARMRVEAALAAVGPDLAAVLVDVCCFLKGLETVERERGWPARSARLLLRTGLRALARHYQPPAPRHGRAGIVHWGAEGYRPKEIGGG